MRNSLEVFNLDQFDAITMAGEGEAPFFQSHRVTTEDVIAPASEGADIGLVFGGEAFKFGPSRDKARRDLMLFTGEFEEGLEEGDEVVIAFGGVLAAPEIGPFGAWFIDPALDGFEQLGAIFTVDEAAVYATHALERLGCGGSGVGDFNEAGVFDDPIFGDVSLLGLFFSPGGDLVHDGGGARFGVGKFDPTPHLGPVDLVLALIGEVGHIFFDPGLSAGLFEFGEELLVDGAEMDHVVEGVRELFFGEGASGPVGELKALIDGGADEVSNQASVSDLISKATDHGGDLGVEEGGGEKLGFGVEDFHILGGRVKDFNDVGVFKEVEEGVQVEPGGLSVDDGGDVAVADLNQAKLRIVGAISHKLCVDGEIGSLRPFFTKGDEFVGVINEHER